jgi:hypothetical protein
MKGVRWMGLSSKREAKIPVFEEYHLLGYNAV